MPSAAALGLAKGLVLLIVGVAGIAALVSVPAAVILTSVNSGSAILGGERNGTCVVSSHGSDYPVSRNMYYASKWAECAAIISTVTFVTGVGVVLAWRALSGARGQKKGHR